MLVEPDRYRRMDSLDQPVGDSCLRLGERPWPGVVRARGLSVPALNKGTDTDLAWTYPGLGEEVLDGENPCDEREARPDPA